MELLIQKIHYNKQKGCYLLKFLLWLSSLFYFCAIKIKNFLYKIGVLKETKIGAYVICVGNLTTGGVGKTPVVIEIANYLSSLHKVAIISRGYRAGLDNKNVNVIKDFNKILVNDAMLAGDEPYLIAKSTSNCAVLTCRDRLASAKYAISVLGADVIIMDDGFSNRKLKKDFTILLFDSKNGAGNSHVLPYGPLREPMSEVHRASVCALVHKECVLVHKENKGDMVFKLNFAPDYDFYFAPDYFYDLKTGERVEPNNQDIVAFCAIGQSAQFYDYLKKYFNVTDEITFKDHFTYSKEAVAELFKRGKTLVTTEKDAVKISKYGFCNIFVLKLKVSMNLEELLKNVKS